MKWQLPLITAYSQGTLEHAIHNQSFQKQKTKTKHGAKHHPAGSFEQKFTRMDEVNSPWALCGCRGTEQRTELREVRRCTKPRAGPSCVNRSWTPLWLWGLSDLQVPGLKHQESSSYLKLLNEIMDIKFFSEPVNTVSIQHKNDKLPSFPCLHLKKNQLWKWILKLSKGICFSRWPGIGEWKKERHACWGNFKPLRCNLPSKLLEIT